MDINVKETNSTVQAICRMIVSCSVDLYNAAQDKITLEAKLKDGRKISITIKEVKEAVNENN